MRHFSKAEKVAGELAVRGLSDKARRGYDGLDLLEVFEYEEDGEKLYAYTGCLGRKEGLTIYELEDELESFYWEDEE